MKYFKRAYLEITNICNLKCSFCAGTKRAPLFMSKIDFINILEKLQGHTKHLYFHVLGEPLLHPNLEEFIALAQEKGYQVQITTNGTLLKEPIITHLLQDGLRQINISLHSWKDNNQVCLSQEFDQYLEQITKFIERAQLIRPELYISLRLWNLNNSNLTYEGNEYVLEGLFRLLNLDLELNPQELTAGRSIKLGKNLFLNTDRQFIWPSLNEKNLGTKGYCYGLKDQIAILVDGTVVPCCLDSEGIISLGNLKEKSLEQIIHSPRAIKIAQGFAQRKVIEPLCQRCDFRTRF